MVKLFTAMSIVDNFMGFDWVHFIWACHERKEPVAPYEYLIVDYEMLSQEEKRTHKEAIDKFFTENEIKELENYLETTYGWDLIAYEAEIPMPSEHADYDPADNDDTDFGTGEGAFYLFKENGYNLSQPIFAYYNFGTATSTDHKSLSLIHRKFGEAFASRLLQELDIPTPRHLRRIIEEIYRVDKLFVAKSYGPTPRAKARGFRPLAHLA